MNFRSALSDENAPDINLIPLIDVLLVILIFLAATTTFSRDQQLKISLPEATADQQVLPSLEVAIAQDGRIAVAGLIIQKDDLIVQLRALSAGKPDSVLLIRADGMAPHQSVVQVMQAAKEAGFNKVHFATQGSQ